MNDYRHLLEVYEPYGYEGPNPVHVHGGGVLRGPNGTSYYLLNIDGIMKLDETAVVQLLIMPRYNGDKIERAKESSCTVNIVRVLPGITLSPDAAIAYTDIKHWGVGKIVPSNGNAR